ncbi:laccase precursor [Fusarium tjaetaba]|uniref:Laccase n=1 Tax=Fusarium tjaetaba TaxID=1567544 RepID=A0A8H5VD14_9HYPO|nr:laccase precursor [Fusarium tjaetaba]KAF5617570.1 laccase precursor [Fusarium tjaetaba]
MGFWKRLTEFLFIHRFTDQTRFSHTYSPVQDLSLVDAFDAESIDGACNSPTNRRCWSNGFDIHTDYEEVIPEGKVRKFLLYVTNERIAPDGYLVDRMLFNGTYPGPTLEGNWGDTFEITVVNKLTNFNGTSIHWHGIRQLNTNWMDGVSGVTECPIPPGENFTYVWRATQYGTSWYHSHFSLQYADGLAGALKINGPTSMDYDIDLGPVLITDNFHKTTFSQVQLEYLGRPPAPDSMLMNGNGRYYCCPSLDKNCKGGSNLTSFHFEPNKTYKMSLVNTAASTHTTFWIDYHDFWVVATDFVPIVPYKTDLINIAIGQRYDIIVNATAVKGKNSRNVNFWMHARDCQNGGARSNLGIIRYDAKSTSIPWTPPPKEDNICYGCQDEPSEKLKPIVQRNITQHNDDYVKNSFKVHLVGYPNEFKKDSMMHKWVLANSSFYLDWAEPSLSLVKIASEKGWNNPQFPVGYEPVTLDYANGTWVAFLIEGKFTESIHNSTTKGHRKVYKTQAPVAHPIHVHGHDFVLLDSGNKEFDPKNFTLQLTNPPRRDVVLLPVDGYIIIAFQINNPGVWLMHCHIAFHASGGLALQFIESPRTIGPMFKNSGILPTYSETCANWAAYYTMFNKHNNATQDDSGI